MSRLGNYAATEGSQHLHDGGPELAALFVTDELSLPTDDGRIVCDILGFRDDHAVVVEPETGTPDVTLG